MKTRYYIVLTLVLAAVAYGIGRYLQPAEVQIKEVEVVKEVEVIKKDVVTIIKERELPDGTKEKETQIIDKSKETTKKETEKEKNTLIVNQKPQWRVQGLAKLNNIQQPIYGAGIERRIFGPISAGIWANAAKEYGVSVSFEF